MSPVPSPGPSQLQNMQQTPAQSLRQKAKTYPVGITAGAEDVKYHAKYKDLKRKVKEIEADNDKLHFKVLQAKRNIQRMKLERAILYERLSAVPPSPEAQERSLPIHTGPGVHAQPLPLAHPSSHHPREIRDLPSSIDSDHHLEDYIRTHGNPRVAPGPDGRPVPVVDTPTMGPGIAPSRSTPYASGRSGNSVGGSGRESRQLPPMPHLPPLQSLEASRSHSSHHGSPNMHHMHTDEHGRSHSSSRSRSHQSGAPLGGHHYQENLPPVHDLVSNSSMDDLERRRHYADHSGDSRHATSLAPLSPRPRSSDSRSGAGRTHNHQRMGPGTYINRDEYLDSERERELERDREATWRRIEHERNARARDHDRGKDREISSPHLQSPPYAHRSRQPVDYQEHRHSSQQGRDEPGYYHDAPGAGASGGSAYPMLSRSGTPGSGSGGSGSGIGAGDGQSRPDSRGQYYEHDRPRASFRLRPVPQPTEDLDFVHEDGRSQSRDHSGAVGGSGGGNFPHPSEQSRSASDSRKRNRNDMEVDVDHDAGPAMYSGEDRGSKRYHRDHLHRGADNQEDDRMGS